MKKQYIDPKTEILAVTPNIILSASTPDVSYENDEDPIDPENEESRRRKDIWDDEEEEEKEEE